MGILARGPIAAKPFVNATVLRQSASPQMPSTRPTQTGTRTAVKQVYLTRKAHYGFQLIIFQLPLNSYFKNKADSRQGNTSGVLRSRIILPAKCECDTYLDVGELHCFTSVSYVLTTFQLTRIIRYEFVTSKFVQHSHSRKYEPDLCHRDLVIGYVTINQSGMTA